MEAVALIEALYTLSDITAEINGHETPLPMGITDPDDIGLIDDIIDAVQDRRHGHYAKSVLREAIAQIARRNLKEASGPRS